MRLKRKYCLRVLMTKIKRYKTEILHSPLSIIARWCFCVFCSLFISIRVTNTVGRRCLQRSEKSKCSIMFLFCIFVQPAKCAPKPCTFGASLFRAGRSYEKGAAGKSFTGTPFYFLFINKCYSEATVCVCFSVLCCVCFFTCSYNETCI